MEKEEKKQPINVLQAIQSEFRAPKSRYNSFAKFYYRSLEDIVEALKPILKRHELALIIDDDLIEMAGRFYIKASAKLLTMDGSIVACSHAFAREAENKSGMDAAQVTGAASSYARKYALNGLLAIDDTKDVDSDEYKKMNVSASKSKFVKWLSDSGHSADDIKKVYASFLKSYPENATDTWLANEVRMAIERVGEVK